MRHLALVLLGTALGAFAAVPALHLIGHQDDHVHIGGAVVHLEDLEDHHDEEEDEDVPSPFDHGAGSLAHFGAVSLEAPGPPDVAPTLEITRTAVQDPLSPSRGRVLRPRARGPPR